VIALLAVVVIMLLVAGVMRSRSNEPKRLDAESLIHRCDFCKEAILLMDNDARCFVSHAVGQRPLFGYRVVNACGACVREHQADEAFSSERADPSS
jgi:hypothetical protein